MRNKPLRRIGLRLLAAGAVLAVCAATSACSAFRVAPWDRDLMAKRDMQLNAYPNVTAEHEHIYFSKEGSSGGRTFDGGGCGCN